MFFLGLLIGLLLTGGNNHPVNNSPTSCGELLPETRPVYGPIFCKVGDTTVPMTKDGCVFTNHTAATTTFASGEFLIIGADVLRYATNTDAVENNKKVEECLKQLPQ